MGVEGTIFFRFGVRHTSLEVWCPSPPNFLCHLHFASRDAIPLHVAVGGIPLEMMVIRVPFSMQQYDVRDPRALAIFRCFLVGPAGWFIYWQHEDLRYGWDCLRLDGSSNWQTIWNIQLDFYTTIILRRAADPHMEVGVQICILSGW